MERLTETIYKKGYCKGKSACEDDCEQCYHFETMIDRLAYYEDLEEQGLLLRLPCKRGDTMWAIRNHRGVLYAQQGIVNEMFFNPEMKLVIVVKNIARGELGQKVFFTKEEAEKKIAEMGGKWDV